MAGVDGWPAAPVLRVDRRRTPGADRLQKRMDELSRRRRWNPAGGQQLMTAPHADQLIDGYLARLRVAATDLPSSVRDELIADMRAHIAEARSREAQETDATVLNILDRLGEPDTVVAEAGRRPEA